MKFKTILISGTGLLFTACATTGPAETIPEPPIEDTTIESESENTILGKYEVIKYGDELPLICDNPVMSDGELVDRPNMQVMWENYLYDKPGGIWGEIGGYVEINGNLPLDKGRWTNACTVRVSHMLNKAGFKIPRERSKTVSGENGDQYYYRVGDLEKFLRKTWGEPDFAAYDGSADLEDLPLEPGLLLMDYKQPGHSFTGHTTVWNGAGTVDNADIGGVRVMLWKLPCYLPPERQKNAETPTTN